MKQKVYEKYGWEKVKKRVTVIQNVCIYHTDLGIFEAMRQTYNTKIYTNKQQQYWWKLLPAKLKIMYNVTR